MTICVEVLSETEVRLLVENIARQHVLSWKLNNTQTYHELTMARQQRQLSQVTSLQYENSRVKPSKRSNHAANKPLKQKATEKELEF